MKHLRIVCVVLCMAASVFAQTSSTAQTSQQPASKPKGQLVYLEVDHVKPGSVTQYESALKTIMSEVTPKLQASSEIPGFSTWAGDDFTFASLSDVKDFADFQRVNDAWESFMTTLGKEKMKQWDAAIGPTIEYTQRYFMREMPDWSYMPSAMTPQTMPVCLVEQWMLTSGSDDKLEQFAGQYKNLYMQKKIQHGYIVYRNGIGFEQPSVTVVSCGKTRAELASNDEADMKLLGKEADDLATRDFLPLARKVNRFYARYRPEFSVQTDADKARMAPAAK